ncbi:peroxiredoxin-like family protein [Wohlfahrtiimonas larvae]|uniref:thioredoxin-dependent peroxiredoxin n=1 Tax=Wohlfahrtiimonas larvae TaxID=1157986 RepID=A0ABP9MJX4_9GAMM|nr:peroxiredoxin-like family protein [Wohlfahrtiimonas larvae]
MALQEALEKIQDEMAEEFSGEVLDAFGKDLNALIEKKIDQKALKIGDQAPEIIVLDTDGQTINLYDLLKHGAVIINFFRGNWCPFCMAELADYHQVIHQLNLSKQQFLFISPQMEEYSAQLKVEKKIDLTLIADQYNQIARQFGLVFTLDENIRDLYKKMGADLTIINGDDSFELPIPATYVVAPSGKITYAFVETNYMMRAEPRDIVSML